MVERFTLTAAEQDPWADADPNGRWVRYSDYAALKAENETLREDNKVLQTEACRAWGLLKETAERALAERAGGVKIKAATIVEDAIKRCRELHDYAGRPAWEKAVEDAITTAITTEPAAPEGR